MVRHGQTDWNLQGKNQGRADIELNKTGIQQAEEVAKQFADKKIDACFSSPLKRASKTAGIIYNGEVIVDDRLMERGNGELEGLVDAQKLINFDDPNETRYGIEPLTDFRKRINEFWDEITKKYSGKDVLVVTHAGFGIYSQAYFKGDPEDGNFCDRYKTKNCEIVQFDNKLTRLKYDQINRHPQLAPITHIERRRSIHQKAQGQAI